MNGKPHNPCGSCGVCCRSYIVPLTGYDVWRISRAQRLAPEQFLVAIEQPEPHADGFRLAAAGPTHGLMLDKQGKLQANRPCVFLLHLALDQDRCGIYPDRPLVCQAYPMVLAPRGVTLRDQPLCPSDAWPESEFRQPTWRRAVRRVTMHFDLYAEVVARWNARVDRAPPNYQFAVTEFLSYLVNVYEQVASLDAELGEDALARVALTWGYIPDPDRSTLRLADLIWPEYHARFRAIVNTFYQVVPTETRSEVDQEMNRR